MSTSKKPTCWIIAGHNGAGKTTFALKYLPEIAHCSAFVNADLIAAGLSPLSPEKELLAASRLFLKEIDSHIKKRSNFAFEKTLSGRSYLKLINQLKKDGCYAENPFQEVGIQQLMRRKPTKISRGLRLGYFIQIRNIINEELEMVWNDTKSPQEALDAAVKRSNKELRTFEKTYK